MRYSVNRCGHSLVVKHVLAKDEMGVRFSLAAPFTQHNLQIRFTKLLTLMKKLYLSEDRMTAGVLAGIAEFFTVDPTLIRLGFIVFMILTGLFPGLLIYLIAWAIIPRKPRAHSTHHESTD